MRAPLVLLVLLAGCATGRSDIHAAKDTWYGALYDDVVSRWGSPHRYTTLSDGGYVYTWENLGTAPGGRIYPSIGIFGGSGGVGLGTGVTIGSGGGERVRCDRTLIFRNGRVAQQIWQGDPDFCEKFKK